MAQNDNNLKQEISSLEKKLKNTKEVTDKCDQAFTDIMVILNGFSAKEGLKLNQAEILIKILPPEELMHTDILKKACEMNHQEEFDKAIEKITNLNFKDSDGKTILMDAIDNGFYYGVDKLLQAGADVNIEDNDKANSLIHCAKTPHIKYMKLIADKTTDIKHKDSAGNNALHYLVPNGNKIIFASELNGELKGTIDHSPLCLDENFIITKDIDIIGSKGSFCLTLDASANITIGSGSAKPISYEKTIRIIKYLVDKGIDINAKNEEGITPLFLSAKYQLANIVDLLFNQYNAIDLPSTLGYTAWDVATFNSSQNLIDIFISKKHINPGIVKLWCAARNGDLQIVEQQILSGINIDSNIENCSNTTALIQAVSFSHLPIISFLVNKGADINKPDKDEASPLYYSLGYAGQVIQPTIVKFLVSKGANVTQSMYDGDTPLHMASYSSNVGAIKLLLSKNVNIDMQNQEGKTSLHVLIKKSALEPNQKLNAIKYLLANSASITLKDKEGHDAMGLAKSNFPEALPWLEHPENLPSLSELETSIIGLNDFMV